MHHSEMMEESLTIRVCLVKVTAESLRDLAYALSFSKSSNYFIFRLWKYSPFLLCVNIMSFGVRKFGVLGRGFPIEGIRQGVKLRSFTRISHPRKPISQEIILNLHVSMLFITLFKLPEVQQHKRISAQNCTILCINDQILFI